MRVIYLWLTVTVLAISTWPALAIVLDVDNPSKYLFSVDHGPPVQHPSL